MFGRANADPAYIMRSCRQITNRISLQQAAAHVHVPTRPCTSGSRTAATPVSLPHGESGDSKRCRRFVGSTRSATATCNPLLRRSDRVLTVNLV